MKKIVVFTGAGISAESGIATYRDSDGLWNSYPVDELATPHAFESNPKLVLDFYNMRKKRISLAQPNAAHLVLSDLESKYEVVIITQNIDDLHERAGSTQVIHLHGEITKAQSSIDPEIVYEWGNKPIFIGQHCELNSQLRPNVIWFGEPVPNIKIAQKYFREADIVWVIGTSLSVQPAASLLKRASYHAQKTIIGMDLNVKKKPYGYKFMRGKASSLVPSLVRQLLR